MQIIPFFIFYVNLVAMNFIIFPFVINQKSMVSKNIKTTLFPFIFSFLIHLFDIYNNHLLFLIFLYLNFPKFLDFPLLF